MLRVVSLYQGPSDSWDSAKEVLEATGVGSRNYMHSRNKRTERSQKNVDRLHVHNATLIGYARGLCSWLTDAGRYYHFQDSRNNMPFPSTNMCRLLWWRKEPPVCLRVYEKTSSTVTTLNRTLGLYSTSSIIQHIGQIGLVPRSTSSIFSLPTI